MPDCVSEFLSLSASFLNSYSVKRSAHAHLLLYARPSSVVPFPLFVQRHSSRNDAQCPRNGDQEDSGSGQSTDTDANLLLHAGFISKTGKEHYEETKQVNTTNSGIGDSSQEWEYDTPYEPGPSRNEQQQLASVRNQAGSLEENVAVHTEQEQELDLGPNPADPLPYQTQFAEYSPHRQIA